LIGFASRLGTNRNFFGSIGFSSENLLIIICPVFVVIYPAP
jgi:hypothetical protein